VFELAIILSIYSIKLQVKGIVICPAVGDPRNAAILEPIREEPKKDRKTSQKKESPTMSPGHLEANEKGIMFGQRF